MKVKVYGTETCPWCHRAREFMEENNVKFEYVDVGRDRKAAMEMIEKTGQRGVPVIEICPSKDNCEIIIGFDEERIRELLEL